MRLRELRIEARTTAIDRKWKSPPKRAGVWPPIRCSRLKKGRSSATEAEPVL